MSLYVSISTAITGLTAQSRSLANVSDNLANTSTTGYKSIGTNFQDIVSSGGSDKTNGAGVRTTPAYYNGLQGSIAASNVETYMAISGRGFFSVFGEDENGDPDTAKNYYTRSGDFTLDSDGRMKNSEGFFLTGWAVDPATGAVDKTTLVPIEIADIINTNIVTTALEYDANLPSSATTGTVTSASTVTVYDSEGEAHDVSYTWEKTATNTWRLTVSAPGAGSPDYTGTAIFTFTDGTGVDTEGNRIPAGRIDTITSTDFTVDGTNLSFSLSYPGATAMPLTASFGSVTQFADETITVSVFSQNGVPEGTFNGISIDKNGLFSINYDNGVSRTYYQIPLALFNAPEQLQRVSGTAFMITEASGTPNVVAAGTDGAGTLATNALENSTVDIADQFTIMIRAQQAYAANAKTITAADSMLKTLITI